MTAIPDLPGGGPNAIGQAINQLGHVAGVASPSYAAEEAFLWTKENGTEPLGDLPGGQGSLAFYSWGYGINDLDQVVGQSVSANGKEAFLWDPNTGMIGLGDLPGGVFDSIAYDINNSGQVLGFSGGNPSSYFIWTAAGGIEELSTGPGGLTVVGAVAINEFGVVAGTCDDGQACLWSKATGPVILGAVPGALGTYPLALNEAGQVVGGADMGVFQDLESFVWDSAHGNRTLTSLLDASSQGYKPLTYPRGINNKGQIIVQHYVWGVLLQPYVPGDSNCDDDLDLQDVKPLVEFVQTFVPGAKPTSYCGWWTADVNQDATLDDKDVTAMWDLLGLSCGDLNGDGAVDQSDLGILLADYGCSAGLGECPGDTDADGDTDQSDLGVLLANYGKACR
jgi:probable HAF family extracellular repeat protein